VNPQPNTDTDPERLTRALRDALVERGWRNIRVFPPEEEGVWTVTAGWIDEPWRTESEVQGYRVTGPPQQLWNLPGRLTTSFKGGLTRIGANVIWFHLDEVVPAHQGIDLDNPPDDFEDDQGDWSVTLQFKITPKPKYWTTLHKATPTDPPQVKPRKPVRSLLTPEQQDQRDEEHRQYMRKLQARGQGSWEDMLQILKGTR